MQAINYACEFVTLAGRRVFTPAILDTPFQACGNQSEHSFGGGDEDNVALNPQVELEPEVFAMQVALAQHEMNQRKALDQTFVREEVLLISPSSNAPRETLPEMRLRDQMWQGEKWLHRKKMFEIANRTDQIFTISVVPKDPELFQYWYQRRVNVRLDFPIEVPCNNYCSKATDKKEQKGVQPTRQMGFLKPFESYTSLDYGVDSKINFEEDWIQYPAEIEEKLENIDDPSLKRNLAAILRHFWFDEEAQSVGIVCHIGQQALAKVFHKTI
ncbi:MAG: hypothetical protein JSS30_00830 [Verrucomicrobia bacterium]|nr:hypothetical protein [Verrucomicrobiota bacterium]